MESANNSLREERAIGNVEAGNRRFLGANGNSRQLRGIASEPLPTVAIGGQVIVGCRIEVDIQGKCRVGVSNSW